MGCVTQIGEQGWNIGRMVPMVAGWPETVAGTTVDRQCGSSMQTNFNAATAIWSGQLDLVVSARRRDDVARADGVERRGSLGQAARALAARPAGDLGRGHRRRVEPVEGGARRVLVGIASAGDRGDRRGPFRERDRPGRGAEPARRHALCGRRDAPPRDVGRGARRSQAVVPARREGDGGQLEPDLRRRGRRARRQRAQGLGARGRAAGAVRLLRAGRRRPLPDAPRQPPGVRPRTSSGRGSAGTTSR